MEKCRIQFQKFVLYQRAIGLIMYEYFYMKTVNGTIQVHVSAKLNLPNCTQQRLIRLGMRHIFSKIQFLSLWSLPFFLPYMPPYLIILPFFVKTVKGYNLGFLARPINNTSSKPLIRKSSRDDLGKIFNMFPLNHILQVHLRSFSVIAHYICF